MAEATTTVSAPIVSAWSSKINWTQAVATLASVLTLATGGKVGLTLEQQTGLVVVIQMAQSVGTWIFRTWFTTSITPSSAAK